MVKELTPLHNVTNVLAYLLEDGKHLQPTTVTLLDNTTDVDCYNKYEDFKELFNNYNNRQKIDKNNIIEIIIRNKTMGEDIQLYIKKTTPSWYDEQQLGLKR
jgi:hypothetical protein